MIQFLSEHNRSTRMKSNTGFFSVTPSQGYFLMYSVISCKWWGLKWLRIGTTFYYTGIEPSNQLANELNYQKSKCYSIKSNFMLLHLSRINNNIWRHTDRWQSFCDECLFSFLMTIFNLFSHPICIENVLTHIHSCCAFRKKKQKALKHWDWNSGYSTLGTSIWFTQ